MQGLKVEVRHGMGALVTLTARNPGDTLAAFQARQTLETPNAHTLQVDIGTHIELEPDVLRYVNHSCEPNCGLVGANLLVAMRDIEPGEELTFDYAMSDDDDYDEFVCACGEATCRGLITGADWRRPELQVKYRGWFSNYIARRIEAEAERMAEIVRKIGKITKYETKSYVGAQKILDLDRAAQDDPSQEKGPTS